MKFISPALHSEHDKDAEGAKETIFAAVLELEKITTRLRSAAVNRNEAELVDLAAVRVANRVVRARSEATEILARRSLTIGPVLDILLDLFINENAARKVSVSDAAFAGRCPATTGLRWVTALEEAGLIEKVNDARDHRRIFLSLTSQGREVTLACIEVYAVVY